VPALIACGEADPVPAPADASHPATATSHPATATSSRATAEVTDPDVGEVAAELGPRRGLWVLCQGSQRILEHPERFPELLADAKRLGATDLFVQVYRGGRAWFDSSVADRAPFEKLVAATGRDTLAELIPLAQASGLRVHAWVNVLSLANNKQSKFLADLGRDAIAVDRRGRSVLDYPDLEVPQPDRQYYRMGTPAVWIDPAAPGVAERLVATFDELFARYPGLDGVHLDYIRYPDVLPFVPGSRFGVGLDFGYGSATRQRFEAETGKAAPFGDSTANANRWDSWRREQVSDLVRRIGGALRERDPDVALSAAVWTYADRAYLVLGQNWRGWLDEGLIEFAVPMSYTVDDALLTQMSQAFAGLPTGQRIWVGLGSWLFKSNPARAQRQVEIVREAGGGGDALFSWDSIAESPELLDALAAGVRDGP
jgi:uncharacterized lipoprotein YddW (UPF0748 family)